jgi:MGT family glycosyltransferase
MSKFLFTMLPANDLGLPTRLVPIARSLADRGHDVALFNPAPAPAKLISEAGLKNLPMPSCPVPTPAWDVASLCAAWDIEHMLAALYSDEVYVRAETALNIELIRDYAPDVVVDSFGMPACMAAHVLKVPLTTLLQGNFHPKSKGFLWWEENRPAGLPSATPVINKLLAEYGVAPVERCADLLEGDLSLIVGTPETDPLPSGTNVNYVGPILWQRGNATLPDWLAVLGHDKPLVWVYSGNPRYANVPTPGDSIVVIRAAIAALCDVPVQVVLTTGYQDLPEEFGALPANFHHAAYLPGLAMAERCELMVHHGGHSSVMTGLWAGTPAVIIPTITERESNARRVAQLGAGEVVLPSEIAGGEKQIDMAEFAEKVQGVLSGPSYRKSAHRIAESMRKFGGAQEAADRIERFASAKT